ncbi:ribosome small subunit-dependent GTPase A [Bacillaceae bacterium S4-13-56]
MPTGKIIKALSGFYYVKSGNQIFQCRGRGVFRKRKITPLVGDEIEFEESNPNEGYILDIKQRKNELKRPPVANVDQAIIVVSAAEPDFHPFLLDRFLVLVESKHIEPAICVTKMDLVKEKQEELVASYIEDYKNLGYEVVAGSSKNEGGIHEVLPLFQDKTSVIAGQSGVGKSSLLNAIHPDLNIETNDISHSLGRGKHTTRHIELIEMNGGLVADTPGFSSLDLTEIELEELSSCFPEMVKRQNSCKFRGCLHLNEPRCAVKEAVDTNQIPSYRYDSYLQIAEEIKNRKPRY